MTSNQEIQGGGGVFTNTITPSSGDCPITIANPTIEQRRICRRRRRFLPTRKRPSSSASATAVTDQLIDQFTKIQITNNTPRRRVIFEPINSSSNPHSPQPPSSSVGQLLRPTTSEPITSPETLNNRIQSPAQSILRRTISEPIPSPEILNSFQSPVHTNLRRTISDPTPALIPNPHSPENYINVTPPVPTSLSPLRCRKLSDRLSSGKMSKDLIRAESPSSKELKRMKDNFRVMSQWFCQAIQEEEDQEQVGCNHHHTENPKEHEDAKCKNEIEAVSVDMTEECLTIRFNCPCTKSYQILLSGNAVYYKLM